LVKITPGAAKGLEELPNVIHRRVIAAMAQLERWPEISGAKPLSGKLAGHYRKRTGDYRVQFRVDGDVVVIECIGHHDGLYGD